MGMSPVGIKRERWIAGLVYNHTIIQPSVTARYAVREIERKSLHNGSHLLQTQITHTQTQFYWKHYSALERHNKKDWMREVYHLLSLCFVLKPIFDTNPVGDLENIPTRIPHLETLHTSFISHPMQPHNCIFPLSFHRVCLCFSVPIPCLSPFLLAKFISGEKRQWQRLKH